MVKKFSAHYIFPLVSSPLKKGIIVINDEGILVELIDTKGELWEADRLEFHSGILIPDVGGKTISRLFELQCQNPGLSLNELIKKIVPKDNPGFSPGKKVSVFLISSLDLKNLRITEKSKLEKLV